MGRGGGGGGEAGNGVACLLEQDFATRNHFLKFKVPWGLSRDAGWDWEKAGRRAWGEKWLNHNKQWRGLLKGRIANSVEGENANLKRGQSQAWEPRGVGGEG